MTEYAFILEHSQAQECFHYNYRDKEENTNGYKTVIGREADLRVKMEFCYYIENKEPGLLAAPTERLQREWRKFQYIWDRAARAFAQIHGME